MIDFRPVFAAFVCGAFLLMTACTGGNNHPGTMMGKFSIAGGTIEAGFARLEIPPNSITLTDTGREDQQGDERGRDLTTYFALVKSYAQPAGYIPGSVIEINAVSNFEAQITSNLFLGISYALSEVPAGVGPGDLAIGHYYVVVTTDEETGETVVEEFIDEIPTTYDEDDGMIVGAINDTGVYFLMLASGAGA